MIAKFLSVAFFGVLLIGGFFAFDTYFTVDESERAVVTRWGKVVGTADPGFHTKMPLVNSVTKFPIDIQEVKPPKAVNTYTIDNQEIDVEFNVFYKIPPQNVQYIYTYVPDYRQRLLVLATDRLKAEMGQVNVTHVAEKRGQLRETIKGVIVNDAKSLGLEITDFQLSNLEYTKTFRAAVEQAAAQKAGVETREYEKQQSQKVAEQAQIVAIGQANAAREQARGLADATLLRAEAEAKSIRLKGEAEAYAIQAQAKALADNGNLVELRRAERWNGALPSQMFGAGPIPFFNVK